jgi:small subunit ribosomal protein S16
MSVAIRMRRAGGKNRSFFHVIVADSRKPRDGKFIEKLGYYDPILSPPVFKIDRERLDHWVSVGAKTSRTVSQLVSKFGKSDEENQG